MSLMEQLQYKKINNKMLRVINTIWISFIALIMLVQNCNAQKREIITDIDTLFKKYDIIYFSNNTTQEDKCEYLCLVYSSYLESEDYFLSTIFESMLIYATRSAASSYNYYLFDNKIYDIYKNIKNEKLGSNTITKMNRLASIFSIQSRNYNLFYIEKCREVNPSLCMQSSFRKSAENRNGQKELLNKGFNFDEFKHLIDTYINIVDVENEELFEIKLDLRKEIIKMQFQLMAIKTGDPRWERNILIIEQSKLR